MAKVVCNLVEQLGLLDKADVGERGAFAFLDVTGDDAGGVADQEHVGQAVQEPPVKAGDHVHGHVLLVPVRLAVGVGADALGGDGGGVCRLAGDHRVTHRVVQPRSGKVGGVERFIRRGTIAARGKGIHHRGGKVAGAGPHGDLHAPTSPL